MPLVLRPLLRACCLLATCVAVSGQWVREANQTLALPADLGSTYVLEDALGGLTFTAPTCITAPPGESNRLFVVERGVQGNPQGPTGSNTEFNPQILSHANSRPAQIIRVEDLNTTPRRQATPFLRLQDVPGMFSAGVSGLYQKNESGLLSMAFHPLYAQNGYFFVFYSLSRNVGTVSAPNWRLFQRISRFRALGSAPYTAATTADPTSEVPLISQLDEMANHNGGDMAFGPDGYLYIALGDEGNFFGSFGNGIYINRDFFSAILRIDVDQRAGNLPPNPHSQPIAGALQNPFPSAVHAGTYRIPAGSDANPFIGRTQWHGQPIAPETVRTEFFAAGMRNPYRMSFDPATGRLFCGDVGERRREEVDLIVKGGDYGWWWKEGSIPQEAPDINHAPPDEAPSPPILSPVKPSPFTPAEIGYTEESYTDPIYEYAHLGKYGEARNCIIGGEVARGSGLAELYGKYLFADYVTGEIAALTETGGVWTRQTLMTGYPNITEFGRDPRTGDVLLVNHVTGTISRIARGAQVSAPPARLSQTGAFANLPLSGGSAATRSGTPLTPHAGLVGYAPNVPFWSDYAIKQRWFALTNLTDTVGFSADGAWTLPTGMVWVKHFDLDVVRGDPTSRRKLETRFLVKTATDVYGLTYRWREDQSDADLVPESGLSEVLSGSVPAQTWRFPNRSECRACHTGQGGFALSFNTRQLNRSHAFGGQTLNQISALSAAGYFDRPVSGVESLPALVPAGDTGRSLESRVRSYLAANCVQCHQPGGAARGNWDARPGTPTGEAGLINGALLNTGDDPLNRFLVPGNPGASMVLHRLRGEGMTRMPPLGTSERDLAAEQLLTDWINSPELVPIVPNLHAPQISSVSNQTVDEGIPLTVTLAGSDADVPAQTLSYGLVSGPPGMTVTPGGVVSWTPKETQGGATENVAVQVTDNGVPPLSVTQSFQVTVRDVPQLGRTVWQLGVDSPSSAPGSVQSAEFSVENGLNDLAPGRVTRLPGDPQYGDATSNPKADDDYYFGGVYPAGFNQLGSLLRVPNDEPFNAWERALTQSDRTNRLHFLLGSAQVAGGTQFRLRTDIAGGGWMMGSSVQPGFGEHDHVVRFRNGAGVATILASHRLTRITNLVVDFTAAQVTATLGANSLELVRPGPLTAAASWLVYDQLRLEVVSSDPPPPEPIYLKPSGFANTGTLTHGQVSLEGIRYLTLTYGRPAPLPIGANYRIEMSSNLVHWAAADVVVVSDPVSDGWETVTVRDRTPLDQGSPRFLRVHVEPATPP